MRSYFRNRYLPSAEVKAWLAETEQLDRSE